MSQLTTLLRSLGARGAEQNVQAVLEARRQEDWAVAVLSARLDDHAIETVAASDAERAPAATSGRAA